MDQSGNMVVALAAGASACMVGKLFVGAQESLSHQRFGAQNGYVRYRGMASVGAIKERNADRYGRQKSAPEGLEGLVPYKGPLKKWIGHDKEWLQGGFSHVGAKDMVALQKVGNLSYGFVRFTSYGKQQIDVRMA
jgi:IMP dehydrogenase